MRIRLEISSDIPAIHHLHLETFPTVAEAKLVDRLRQEADPFLSLVAETEGELIGHLLFTPVTLETSPQLKVMGLAPLAVHEDFQGEGIGSALVKKGLRLCKEKEIEAVVVLGHATYYPRFGFQPAADFGIHCPYPVPSEVFMARELVLGSLGDTEGLASYHPAFDHLDEE